MNWLAASKAVAYYRAGTSTGEVCLGLELVP